MSNTQQNNEIEHINKEINLLQEILKKTRKRSKSISKWVNANWKNTSKKGKSMNLSQTKQVRNIVRNIFQNKIKQIKKKALIYCKIHLHM